MGQDRDAPQGAALIDHTRKQAETVVACLDSLAGLWRLMACPDPSAHPARSTPVEALASKIEQTSRIRDALHGCESLGALDNWLIEELGQLRSSATIPRSTPVEALDVTLVRELVAALDAEIAFHPYEADAPTSVIEARNKGRLWLSPHNREAGER